MLKSEKLWKILKIIENFKNYGKLLKYCKNLTKG